MSIKKTLFKSFHLHLQNIVLIIFAEHLIKNYNFTQERD